MKIIPILLTLYKNLVGEMNEAPTQFKIHNNKYYLQSLPYVMVQMKSRFV